MRLAGKTALVTAASAGIGRATAVAFAREGAQVVAIDIDAKGLATLAIEHASISTELIDVIDRSAIERLRHQRPKFNVLVNAVGWVHNGSILECDEKDWSRSLQINVSSMFHVIKAWLPGMVDAGGGSIINVASVASSLRGVPSRFAYSASKAAVIGLTKSIAADFVTRGVRCNAICPGTIDTPSLHERWRATGDESAARTAFVARQPMGRLGTAGEVAALAVYLASDESAFTTGTAHVIDGGWTM